MKNYVLGYFALGFVWWLAEEVYYVGAGRPYWKGFGSLDTSNPVENTIIAAQTIGLWPVSVLKTVGGGL